MPPKSGKAGSAKNKPKEEEREDTLQAVILADSFEKRFVPFTDERPRCLLPLANTPLIEYTFEFLAHAGVEEIFVYCGAHTEQVEEYVEASKWRQSSSPFTSLTLLRSSASSVGDAMRDLDGRGLITGDFLLVSGDVVSNLSIEPALIAHRMRRKKDKNAIMTMVLREAGLKHRVKPKSSRPVFFIDPTTNRCIHYAEMNRKRAGKHRLELDTGLIKEHPEIDIRGDLLDCSIDICTPDVLSLWSDNFDYQSIRTSFLFGVLKDYELNGKTIHTYIESKGYAARVRSLRAYDAITRDIIDRWTYPLTPDCNLVQGQTYSLGKAKTYIEQGVILARGSIIGRRSIVGSRTSIGDGSTVTNSVLGRRCQIGKNVTIRDSYVWDDVVIGDNSTVIKGMIASEASVSRSCNITSGTLISFGAQVADSTTTEEGSIYKKAPETKTGAHSDGYDYDSDESTPSAHLLTLSPTPSFVSLSSVSTLHSDSDLDQDSRSLNSEDFLDPTPTASQTALQKDFLKEAAISIYDGLTAGEDRDKIRLELVAQRLATDAADSAVRDALVDAFMRRVWTLIEGADSNEKVSSRTAVKNVFSIEAYGSLLKQMGIFEQSDQVAVLSRIEASCREKAKGAEVLLFAATEAHEGGLLQDEGVFEWWATPHQGPESLRSLTSQFVDYLRDDDDEDEESSEEGSDEDSDSDG